MARPARNKKASEAAVDDSAPESSTSNGLMVDTKKQPADVATLAYEPITINNYNLTDLKNTLDDAVKRVRGVG